MTVSLAENLEETFRLEEQPGDQDHPWDEDGDEDQRLLESADRARVELDV